MLLNVSAGSLSQTSSSNLQARIPRTPHACPLNIACTAFATHKDNTLREWRFPLLAPSSFACPSDVFIPPGTAFERRGPAPPPSPAPAPGRLGTYGCIPLQVVRRCRCGPLRAWLPAAAQGRPRFPPPWSALRRAGPERPLPRPEAGPNPSDPPALARNLEKAGLVDTARPLDMRNPERNQGSIYLPNMGIYQSAPETFLLGAVASEPEPPGPPLPPSPERCPTGQHGSGSRTEHRGQGHDSQTSDAPMALPPPVF
jgi:hypothetical protein